MTATIRIIDSTAKEERFAERLEEKAHEIVQELPPTSWDASDTTIVGRELALIVSQIHRLRALEEREIQQLLRIECYVGTELLQMEERTPRYSPYRFPEREKLQRRLMTIDQERRRLVIGHEDKLRQLHDRLLYLLEQHTQLTANDGR